MGKNLNIRKGQCTNFGNCKVADSKQIVELDITDEFECPECKNALMEIKSKSFPWGRLVAVVAAVILLGGGTFMMLTSDESAELPSKLEDEKVEVKEETVAVERVALSETEIELNVGESKELVANVFPGDASDKQVTWKSLSPEIASVSENGVIEGVKVGTAVVRVITNDGQFTADCQVKVKEAVNKETTPSRVLNLGYATYEGDIKDGKAHGNGVMTFTKRAVIPGAKGDPEAEVGERVEGTFRTGEIGTVTWYKKDGNKPILMHK